jgi:hypothetical protein
MIGITDYRKILSMYMRTVRFEEGTTFVRDVPNDALTKEEWGALYEIENEIERDHPDG